MKANEWISALQQGTLEKMGLYTDVKAARERYVKAIESFTKLYGEDRELYVFSVPGRTEVQGNHTDHQHGRVLAAAIDRDLIAVAAKNASPVIRIKSEGFPEDTVSLSPVPASDAVLKYSSRALVAGTAACFASRGYEIGGFDAYTTSQVLKGSGISSSAAFEVMVGNMLSHLYNGGEIPNEELAKIAQYAENEYFGKPCGLMDQMACAVGGFVFIDFEDPKAPVIRPIPFSLKDAGYALCIVNTGGNHADLNEDYASVPMEMKKIAAYFGKDVLRGITLGDIVGNIPVLRAAAGDRAVLRAIHFITENDRVLITAGYLEEGNLSAFLGTVLDSGNSSFRFLQNVYTTKNAAEQGLSLALAVTENYLGGKECAWRVHGGGFAGTVQAFVKKEYVENYAMLMNSVFGEGACMVLNIREAGAIQIEL